MWFMQRNPCLLCDLGCTSVYVRLKVHAIDAFLIVFFSGGGQVSGASSDGEQEGRRRRGPHHVAAQEIVFKPGQDNYYPYQ